MSLVELHTLTPVPATSAVDDQTFSRIATVALVGNLVFAAGVLVALAVRALT